jgi:hypothetical protein
LKSFVNRGKLGVWTIFLLLCFTITVQAETYFVNMSGSNSDGYGTSDYPWKTVAYALSQSKSGDVISIDDGEYSEQQLIVPPGVNITSSSRDSSKVRIYPATSLVTDQPLMVLSSKNPGDDGNQSISYIELDGSENGRVARVGILVENRNNVRIHHNNIHDFTGVDRSFGVIVRSTQIPYSHEWWHYWPTDPQGVNNDQNLNALWPTNPVEGFELDNNAIVNCGYRSSLSSGLIFAAVYPFNLKDSLIHDNVIDTTQSRGQCIYATSSFLWNVDIYNNNLSMNRYTDRASFAIELWNMRNGCQFYHNTSNGGFSIIVGKETQINNNRIVFDHPAYEQGCIGIEFIDQTEGAVFENYIEGAGVYGISAGMHNNEKNFIVRNIKIRDNIVVNTNGAAICIYVIGSDWTANTLTVDGVEIHNNKLDGNRSLYYGLLRLDQREGEMGRAVLKNVSINGNIALKSRDYAGKTVGTVTGVTGQFNIFWENQINQWYNGATIEGMVIDPSSSAVNDVGPVEFNHGRTLTAPRLMLIPLN